MSGRVVLLGATGHTGFYTAKAMAMTGVPLLLAARSAARLNGVVSRLPGAAPIEVATFDATRPETVTALLNSGDVLVSTVGPFDRLGRPALLAAIEAGVPYVDCSGESAFLRWVFESELAARAKCALLPGYGFESVAGNVAASLALQEAGDEAAAVDVLYVCDRWMLRVSRGTVLSALSEIKGCAVSRVHSELRLSRVGGDTVSIAAGGRQFYGMSITTTEPWTLPGPASVRTYLGGPRWRIRPLMAFATAADAARRWPTAGQTIERSLEALGRRASARPAREVSRTGRTLVIARVLDNAGCEIRRVLMGGADPYVFTASVLAGAACAMLARRVYATGPCGPVAAFGLPAALADVERAGMVRISEADESVLSQCRDISHRQRRNS